MEEVNNVEELAKLRRTFRICESERKAYHRDTTITLLKQKTIIRKLEHEKNEIFLKISLDHCKSHEKKYGKTAQKLFQVLKDRKAEMQLLREQIEQQKKLIHSLENDVRKLKHKNNDLNVYQKMIQSQKKIRSLEDRLENTFGRYNRISHKMSQQRETINHLIFQRNTYKGIWQQLSNSFAETKRQVEVHMTSAANNYNKREELYQKYQAIKQSQKQDRKLCCAQLQEAERSLVNQTEVFKFMAIKNRKRTPIIAQTENKIGSHTAQIPHSLYFSGDASNFELFNFGCSLCSKYETLQSEIQKLKEELAVTRDLDNESVQRSESSFKELEEQTAVAFKETQDAEKYVFNLKKCLPSLKSGLESMINAVGGDAEVLTALEPDSQDLISKSLLVNALQEIEKRVNRLLQTKLFFDSQVKDKEPSLQLHTTAGNIGFIQSFQPVRSGEDTDLFPIKLTSDNLDSMAILLNSPNNDSITPLSMRALKQSTFVNY